MAVGFNWPAWELAPRSGLTAGFGGEGNLQTQLAFFEAQEHSDTIARAFFSRAVFGHSGDNRRRERKVERGDVEHRFGLARHHVVVSVPPKTRKPSLASMRAMRVRIVFLTSGLK